ncbi:Rgp1-domain-containing protein [Xylariales sp. AK1849]|nr:Rgp1-domain-containing protein [Xylariales sp. AK1849]
MSPDAPSSIRVFIHWNDQTVFAGEEIKCRITFKNVARPLNQHPHQERQRQPSPLLGTPRKPNINNGLTPPVSARGRGHRSTLSLNVPSSHTRSKSSSTTPWLPNQPAPTRPSHAHKRSLSIVSIGSAATEVEQPHSNGMRGAPQRPGRGHGRSASLQISPRASGILNGPHSAALPQRPYGGSSQASPIFNNHSFPPSRYGRPSGASTVPNTPGIQHTSRKGPAQMPDWQFPTVRSPLSETADRSPSGQDEDYLTTPVSATAGAVNLPVRSKDSIPSISEHPAPAARVLMAASITGGTPRSSGEFYSLSNNSSETLASEYVTQPLRNGVRPPHIRRGSGMSGLSQARIPEALMMGYAQVQGSFTLDGSLVNLGPFEAVKRKAVLGGQGGGVIGLESSKRDSGLLKSFGWGTWGNSIGELLSGGELSSIKEMRGVASSKSVPLLSTPQSILFVDLQLAPGESKSYEYSFKLPKGLPPTHRGKAMKISYSLVIGTQRPGGAKEQRVKSVDIPFRVLGSVNSHGEILGHDLMSPYILLRDLAKVQLSDQGTGTAEQKKGKPMQPGATLNGFLGYVEELLDRPRNGFGLLSPTAQGPSSRRPSAFEEAATAREAIDFAIMRSNLSSESGQSTNRFEIARNGQRVGVVMLARPAYRLGEAVSMAIDFTDAEIPCYAVHAALETAERVDPSFALRSEASVHRVTRKVYGSSSEATLFARRVVFSPTIPIGATPEFVTSGLSLEWKIRIEFVVPSSATEDPEAERRAEGPHPLLDEISSDDRGGLVLVAAENLECESFEVAVPLRVYGAVCSGLERLERDEAEEGLAV